MVSPSSIAGTDSGIVRERPFQLLLLVNVLPPLGTALLSPVLGSLVEPLGASTANIGLMMSAFTAPSIAVIPIAGVISDRYGRRPVLLFGLVWFGLTGTAIAFVSTFGAALALRALQGIGFAALTPIIITSLGDLYTGTKEATAQGFRFTGSGLSQTVFPLAAGVLVGMAWQYPFLLYAVAFPIAAVVYVHLEEPLDEAGDEEAEAGDEGGESSDGRIEAGDEEAEASDEGSATGVRDQIGDMRALVAHRRAWTMVVARGSANVAWFGFLTYNSILVVDVLGYTPAEAGALAALASLTYALAATQAGRIAEVFDDRLYPLLALNLSMGTGLGLAFLARSLAVAAVGVALMGVGFGLVLSIYRSVITTLPPPDLRGGLVSLGEGSGRAAATATPVVMGVAVALATRPLGFEAAVRAVGAGAGVVGAGVGIVCLLLMSASPPIRMEG
ncbi:MFS transporter [Halorubrum sp. GN11_10-6_MGM]|uniref:MFS transporter n=1 Tax=Halorubrum sp. GN11_10-6_MGM TaxID=2518112 RepID=UPI0010FA286E|nr:MFS transporter [Halorubrum sp. GN11_10-6_MGM]TKX73959.1 MFS transporter [Halorubrum sp. GN11_10-6_MGM]